MSRDQIRVRVDSEQWESWRNPGEGNTELLTRILTDWQHLRQALATLTDLDPNPSQALGRLLTSHELLSAATVTIHPAPEPSTTPPPISSSLAPQPTAVPDPPAAEIIGGLENNGDDW